MEWQFKNTPCTELPKDKIGFVYVTHYDDGSYYIGKRLCYSMRTVPAIKSTPIDKIKWRIIVRDEDGKICVTSKARARARSLGCVGKKEPYREVWAENNWRKYEGSSSIKDGYKLITKEIVHWCATKKAMTYIEADLQFRTGSLFDTKCLNLNILGKFFPNIFAEEDIDETTIFKNDK